MQLYVHTSRKVQLGQGDVHTYAVASVHKHPKFVSLAQNDIALLKLGEEVQYTGECLPKAIRISFIIIMCSFYAARIDSTDLPALAKQQSGAAEVPKACC